MRLRLVPLLLLALLTAAGDAATERPLVAFGYLTNETAKGAYGFIEIVFPKSFAHSIASRYDVDVRNPLEVDVQLKKSNESLKKSYNYVELPELVEKLKAQVFINGSYAVLPENRIRISLNIFTRGSNEVFTFTNVGKMETDISRLVDRVSVIIMNYFEEDRYRAGEIAPGARIGLLANLDNLELNRLYGAFMKRNHPVVAIQGNHPGTYLGNESIDRFKYMLSEGTSYTAITDWRKIKLSRTAWNGPRDRKHVDLIRRIYRVFDLEYPVQKKSALERISEAFSGSMDYLLVIGFSRDRSSAWIRCINIREKDFVWMQDDYRRGAGDPVAGIADQVIDSMRVPVKNPFQAGGAAEK